MNHLDRALQANTPAVMVPCFEALAPLERTGHRFLVAESGLWVESRRPWCHIVWPLGQTEGVKLPFGRLEPKVELAFGKVPRDGLERFIEQARAAVPNETAAVMIWNERTGDLRYERLHEVNAGAGFVSARWAELGEDESVVLDMHSHGRFPAFFSGQDRRDIGAQTVMALVVGKADTDRPQVIVSVFTGGLEITGKPPSWGLSEEVDEGMMGLV